MKECFESAGTNTITAENATSIIKCESAVLLELLVLLVNVNRSYRASSDTLRTGSTGLTDMNVSSTCGIWILSIFKWIEVCEGSPEDLTEDVFQDFKDVTKITYKSHPVNLLGLWEQAMVSKP